MNFKKKGLSFSVERERADSVAFWRKFNKIIGRPAKCVECQGRGRVLASWDGFSHEIEACPECGGAGIV